MKNRFTQGLKPKLIKQIAMLMSICYLLGPLQPQLTLLLHEISHGLEMPNSVLSHDIQVFDYKEVHDSHKHDNTKVDHDHKLIDIVDSIFEASNENHDSEKAPKTKVELKKHTTSEVLAILPKFLEKVPKEFREFNMPLNLGHSKILDVPPQLLLA